jgi:hypothetical protein
LRFLRFVFIFGVILIGQKKGKKQQLRDCRRVVEFIRVYLDFKQYWGIFLFARRKNLKKFEIRILKCCKKGEIGVIRYKQRG